MRPLSAIAGLWLAASGCACAGWFDTVVRVVAGPATNAAAAGVPAAYKALQAAAPRGITSFFGADKFDVDAYVTRKATDGLFQVVAAEEQRIRADPMARTTDLLRRVFGAASPESK
jgi:hypothetical protein